MPASFTLCSRSSRVWQIKGKDRRGEGGERRGRLERQLNRDTDRGDRLRLQSKT